MHAAGLLPETLPADWSRPLVERQLALLGRLAEAGLEIAVALEGQAQGKRTGGESVVQGDVAMAYNRVARAVRQTIMLQSKLIEALQDHEAGRAGRKASARAGAARLVRGVIDDDRANDAEHAERLAAEAAERLRAEDFGDLLSRPFADAVAQIVKDLGLSPNWLALAEDCFEAEAALLRPPAEGPQAPVGPIEVRWLDDDDPEPNSS